MRKAGGLLNTTRPMSGPGRWLRFGTMMGLLGFTALAELAGWLGGAGDKNGAVVAALVLIAVLAATIALPWHRWPEDWQALVPLALIGAVVLLDYAGDLYYIVTVPILWLALFHTRRVLVAGIVVAAVAIFLPRALSPEGYMLVPLAEVILVYTVIMIAGLGMHELVGHARDAAVAMGAALEREREAAERLRQLDQTRNDFVATVSHDLRTPLTSIIGNTEILLDGDGAGALPAPQRRMVSAIDRNARRLNTLIGDLLLLSHVESGALRMDARPVAIHEIIDGALEALAASITDDIQVDVQKPDEPLVVESDPAQLERVTTNLLSNALKFTPPGGRVTVTVTADAEQVQVSVSDTGIGIPADEIGQVFDRFFRSSRSQQKGRPGTGLGLTIVKSIIEHHHGTIRAALNPAGGTTFTITLPRLASPADTPQRKNA